jgi:hypothetical protein
MNDNCDGARWPKGYPDFVKPHDELLLATQVVAQLPSELRVAANLPETRWA